MKLALMIVVLFLSVGCQQGKPFQAVIPPFGKSVVYVYRTQTGFQGSAVTLAVKCDGQKFGEVQNASYVYAIVPAGKHVISSKTETTSEIPFDAMSGQSYYITADVEWGFWVGRPRLVMVPEEQGRLAILSTKYFGKEPQPSNAYDPGTPRPSYAR